MSGAQAKAAVIAGCVGVVAEVHKMLIESLSKDVFERRTSTGSEVFSLTICLEAKKSVLLSFFSLIKTIYLRVSTKPPPNDAKRPLPVDVRRSKTLLLKLPIVSSNILFGVAPRHQHLVENMRPA